MDFSKSLSSILALSLPVLLVVMIFTYVSISDFKNDIHKQLLENELKTVSAVSQTLVTGFKTKFEKGVYNSLKNSKKLQENMNSVLRALIKDKYEYSYLIYKDKKGKYRFLLDGTNDEENRAEFNQIFIAQNENWDKIFIDKKAKTFDSKSSGTELWITYLEPIIINNEVEAVLAVDFSTKDEKEILIILGKIESVLFYTSIFTLFVLAISTLVNILNIKETKKAKIANMAKSNFIANISHEIRTPMNAIFGMTELLGFTQLTKKQSEYLKKITTASSSLLLLLNDVLDFSKIEANKIVIDKINFNLFDLIENIKLIHKDIASAKGLDFYIEYKGDIKPNLIGDPLRLGQILTNLISNGIKFTKEGYIKIIVSQKVLENNMIQLEFNIIDTGIGIKSNKINNLFQPFNQADNSITREYGGTGLGLSISYNLVVLQNGKIWLDTTNEKGACFKFYIEVEYSDEKVERGISDSEKIEYRSNVINLNKAEILLVEDNEINQDVIKSALEDTQFNLTIASNGLEAVEIFEINKFNLIIMDIQMPIMDGYSATKLIRQKDEKIPIIALSANAMISDIQKSKKYNMDAHLSKPIKMNDLYKTLYKYLNHLGNIENKKDSLIVKSSINYDFKYLKSEEALSMINHNNKLYISMLEKFLNKYKNKDNNLKDIIKNDKEAAIIIIHTAKGLSGNIGAVELNKITTQLNQKLKEDIIFNDSKLVDSYEYCLENVLMEIEDFLNKMIPKKEIALLKLDNNEFYNKLISLIEPLENSQMLQAKKIIKDLEFYQISDKYLADFKLLAQCVKKYKSDEALNILKRNFNVT